MSADDTPYAVDRLPRRDPVGIEPFAALDLRVGRIVAVEEFPEARRPAWKLEVDFGPAVGHLRTSARIPNYRRAELLGRFVVAAINLGDKRIAGFTSQCLVLGGLAPDGTVHLLAPDGGLEPGAPVA